MIDRRTFILLSLGGLSGTFFSCKKEKNYFEISDGIQKISDHINNNGKILLINKKRDIKKLDEIRNSIISSNISKKAIKLRSDYGQIKEYNIHNKSLTMAVLKVEVVGFITTYDKIKDILNNSHYTVKHLQGNIFYILFKNNVSSYFYERNKDKYLSTRTVEYSNLLNRNYIMHPIILS